VPCFIKAIHSLLGNRCNDYLKIEPIFTSKRISRLHLESYFPSNSNRTLICPLLLTNHLFLFPSYTWILSVSEKYILTPPSLFRPNPAPPSPNPCSSLYPSLSNNTATPHPHTSPPRPPLLGGSPPACGRRTDRHRGLKADLHWRVASRRGEETRLPLLRRG
jgi:hypothetical protein